MRDDSGHANLQRSLGLIHICLRFGNQEKSGLYQDLVIILETLHVRRYVSVSLSGIVVSTRDSYCSA